MAEGNWKESVVLNTADDSIELPERSLIHPNLHSQYCNKLISDLGFYFFSCRNPAQVMYII